MTCLPPTADDPLLITTPEGRVISCAVRCLRRRPSSPRWVFVTALCNSTGFLDPTVLVGPPYLPDEHNTIDAIRELVCQWWRAQTAIERSHEKFARWFGGTRGQWARPTEFEHERPVVAPF